MKRRQFLAGAGAGGAALAAASSFPAPAISQGRKEWIVVSAFGKTGILGEGLNRFAEVVTKASNGKLSVRAYHGGELVQPLEAMDAVQSGTAQMGYGAPYYWQGKVPALSYVAAVPFGLNAQEQNAWFYYGGGIEAADKAYAEVGTKFLPMGNTGNQMGGWFRKEINTSADLQGLKFRMPGLGGEILKTLGVNVVLTSGADVLPTLASGGIDGTEWIGPAADLGLGLYKVCKYYYYPGWHEPATVLDGFIDRKAWDALDSDLQNVVTAAAQATNLTILSEFQARNNAALKALVTEHGVELRRYSDELLSVIGKRAGEVLHDLAGKDPLSKSTFQEVLNFRTTAVQWANYSEGAFIAARAGVEFPT